MPISGASARSSRSPTSPGRTAPNSWNWPPKSRSGRRPLLSRSPRPTKRWTFCARERLKARRCWCREETDMKYRKLGASDLEVSEISLGSWLTYGVGVEADAARLCLQRAVDLGINFIDTANIYGRGAAESFLGEALGRYRRESYILATKLFFPMTEPGRR